MELLDHAVRLRSVDPAAPLDDLEWLDEVVGDARVVAVGESAHYTAEFTHLRHRLLRYLVTRHGFTALAAESGFAEGLRVNRWVHGADDSLDAVLAEGMTSLMGLWTPVRAQVAWMRQAGVGFHGVDLSGSNASVLSCLDVVGDRVDPDLRRIAASFAPASPFSIPRAMAAYLSLPDEERDTLTDGLAELARQVGTDDSATARAARLAVHIDAVARHSSRGDVGAVLRERGAAMADTVEWVLRREPRIVLGAHNAHLQRRPVSMLDCDPAPTLGLHLADRLGPDYRVVATTSGGGRTLNTGPDFYTGALFTDLGHPPHGTLDSVLHDISAGVPTAILGKHLPPGETKQRMGADTLAVDPHTAYDAVVHIPSISAAPPDPGAVGCSPDEVRTAFSGFAGQKAR